MNDKAHVSIALESEIDGEEQRTAVEGEWYRKGGAFFLKYAETEGGSEVRTIVRWRDGELSITRRGAVESEQLFTTGVRRSGRYESRHAAFSLETDTSLLQVRFGDGLNVGPGEERREPELPLLLEWHYGLLVGGEPIGNFKIRLRAEEN
ncbi:DUF1934 domain-containing protein [Paenibacillus lycopersici]|uniref:DUF1934 domain-containing protein n=1 Tax=Paenibacillus lycopersici TaxID=2704462 RepID=A0A6C0FXD9_9BACL|nr:DUF1934 domain-containing protein [Paenibacillus lycopersici]QHT58870.1 DUF1934 domain-containing protein [Paenibacillus lycopersici]